MTDKITMLEAERMIQNCYKWNEPLFLIGHPGAGKTALYESSASNLGIGLIDWRLPQRDPVDVGGMRIPDEKSGLMKHYLPNDFPCDATVKEFGKKGIFLFDEPNAVGPMMQATTFGIIQERRLGMTPMLPGWVPMAAGNDLSDRASAQRLSSAMANRFNIQHVVQDVDGWLKQYGSEHVDPRMCAFLRFRKELLCVMPKGDQKAFASPRSWTKSAKAIDLPAGERLKTIRGWVGDNEAGEFEAFLKIMATAVTMDQIENDPDNARVPPAHEAGQLYAVAGMIGRSLTRKNVGNVIKYVKRLPADYQAAILHDAGTRNPDVKATAPYGAWLVANQDIMA